MNARAPQPGDRVVFTTPHGERTGRVVMRGTCGWVVNCGGPHGTPAVVTAEQIVRVSTPKRDAFTQTAEIVDRVR